MKITPQLEKIFLAYLRQNIHQSLKVQPWFFKTPEIAFLYKILKQTLDNNGFKNQPSQRQLIEHARLENHEGKFNEDALELVLNMDISDLSEEDFILPNFKAWVISNGFKKDVVEIIEKLRGIEDLNLDSIEQVVSYSREIINRTSLISWSNDELGLDFDDPQSHFQDSDKKRISTGWKSLNAHLGGGWGMKTLNVITAAPGVGKSQFLCNATVNVANSGKTGLYASFEMSKKEVIKRIGSNRLSIPIDKYEELSKNQEYIKKAIDKLNKNIQTDSTFSGSGKIYINEWPTGTCTVYDLDNWIKTVQEKTGKKVDFLAVDYLQLMNASLGKNGSDNLYLKGKHLAEGLRSIAMKYDLAVLTATQIDKDMYGANDAFLEDIPESKAIAETADFVYGIIQTPAMKKDSKYRLKGLKFRSTIFSTEQILFDFNKEFLRIENDRIYN